MLRRGIGLPRYPHPLAIQQLTKLAASPLDNLLVTLGLKEPPPPPTAWWKIPAVAAGGLGTLAAGFGAWKHPVVRSRMEKLLSGLFRNRAVSSPEGAPAVSKIVSEVVEQVSPDELRGFFRNRTMPLIAMDKIIPRFFGRIDDILKYIERTEKEYAGKMIPEFIAEIDLARKGLLRQRALLEGHPLAIGKLMGPYYEAEVRHEVDLDTIRNVLNQVRQHLIDFEREGGLREMADREAMSRLVNAVLNAMHRSWTSEKPFLVEHWKDEYKILSRYLSEGHKLLTEEAAHLFPNRG